MAAKYTAAVSCLLFVVTKKGHTQPRSGEHFRMYAIAVVCVIAKRHQQHTRFTTPALHSPLLYHPLGRQSKLSFAHIANPFP
jgi:hypothetical protein